MPRASPDTAGLGLPYKGWHQYSPKNFLPKLLLILVDVQGIYVGTQTRKLPIPVRGSAIPVLVPILELTSVLFLIAIFPKYNRIH